MCKALVILQWTRLAGDLTWLDQRAAKRELGVATQYVRYRQDLSMGEVETIPSISFGVSLHKVPAAASDNPGPGLGAQSGPPTPRDDLFVKIICSGDRRGLADVSAMTSFYASSASSKTSSSKTSSNCSGGPSGYTK